MTGMNHISSPMSLLLLLLVCRPVAVLAIDYTALEQEIFKTQNVARTDPQAFKIRHSSRLNDDAKTFIDQLAGPLGALSWNNGMRLAAQELVVDQGATGKIGHVSSDGSTCKSCFLA